MTQSESSPYTWIQTRDGSPTLWNNELGESFRSTKGAFTESWNVFVNPCLERMRKNPQADKTWIVGEFGLGPGTNWLLLGLSLESLRVPFFYFVIERDLSSFEAGLRKWQEWASGVSQFLRYKGIAVSSQDVEDFLARSRPTVCPSLLDTQKLEGRRAQIWFHDPFGFSVNSEGYTLQCLEDCSKLWAQQVWGASYACNKNFQLVLEQIAGVTHSVCDTGNSTLKRQRLEFFRV